MGDSPPFFYEWCFWATFLKAEGNPPLVFVRSVIGEGMTGLRAEGRLSPTDPALDYFHRLRRPVDDDF